jgi:rhodanese-related sulfurtransferase
MTVKDINANEFRQLIDIKKGDLEIIDVREQDEFSVIKFKHSRLIPMDDLKNRLEEIDWNRMVVFVCRTGARSRYIASVVMDNKRKIINLQGGIVDFYYNFDSEDFLEINTDKVDEYV